MDRLVTLAKSGTLAARRQLIRRLGSREVARVFVEEIAPHFKERNGGYARVLKTRTRPGDGARMALIEFTVPIEIPKKGGMTFFIKDPAGNLIEIKDCGE